MNPLDESVELQQDGARAVELQAKEVLAREFHLPLKALIDETPNNLKAIEEYLPTFSAALDKAERGAYTSDPEIAGLLRNRQTSNNLAAIRIGIKRYNEITWKSMLNRKGEIDRNAPAHLVNEIRGYLNCGRGCRKSMERIVQRLDARTAYLLTAGGQSVPMPEIRQPEKKTTRPTVNTEFDPRRGGGPDPRL
jgi:hypothetical protein